MIFTWGAAQIRGPERKMPTNPMGRVSVQAACQQEYGQNWRLLKVIWPYSWWPIICGLKLGRQRGPLALGSGVVTLAVLVITSGCQAQSSVQAAQTALVTGQSALATVQPMLATVQPVVVMLQGALAGAKLDVKTSPDGAQPQDVTDVNIQATDAQGNLTQVDPQTRQAAVRAALMAASQYYPKANIALKVVDASGATVLSGSVAPGQTPSIQ